MQQFLVLFKRKATVFTSSPVLGYNDVDYRFNSTDGFRVAFILWDSYSADGIDSLGRPEEEFGTLTFIKWTRTNWTYIQTHRCTEDELDAFYPLTET